MFLVIIFALLFTDVCCQFMTCSVASILDCSIYPQQNVCGSDGTTYGSKCSFEQARCRDDTLSLRGYVACADLTSTVTQPDLSTDTSAAVTSPATSSAPSTTLSEAGSTTAASTTPYHPPTTDASTSPSHPPTTTAQRSTMDSKCVALLNNACPSTFQPVCGSDGNIYPNSCYSSQARCRDPSLTFYYDGRCFSKFTFARRAATTTLPKMLDES